MTWLISDFTYRFIISRKYSFSSLLCMQMCSASTWAKVFHFAQRAKWNIKMAASSHYPPMRSSKPTIQNPFRGRCYITGLKSLSRGDSPPTTSISRASYSVVPTEAWSERGHRLHLPLPVVRAHERLPGTERRAAELAALSPGQSGWSQRKRDIGGREKGEGRVGDVKELVCIYKTF